MLLALGEKDNYIIDFLFKMSNTHREHNVWEKDIIKHVLLAARLLSGC